MQKFINVEPIESTGFLRDPSRTTLHEDVDDDNNDGDANGVNTSLHITVANALADDRVPSSNDRHSSNLSPPRSSEEANNNFTPPKSASAASMRSEQRKQNKEPKSLGTIL